MVPDVTDSSPPCGEVARSAGGEEQLQLTPE